MHVKMQRQVKRDGKKVTETYVARKPTTVTKLKSQGWKVVEPPTKKSSNGNGGSRRSRGSDSNDTNSGTSATA